MALTPAENSKISFSEKVNNIIWKFDLYKFESNSNILNTPHQFNRYSTINIIIMILIFLINKIYLNLFKIFKKCFYSNYILH